MADDEKKCLEAGCNGYIAKPIDRQRLVCLIASSIACGPQPAGAQLPTEDARVE
jgi:CheY-like chemotaxis protein